MAMKQPESATDESRDSVRLDLWLWAARFFKTRALAKHAIETGKIEIDGQRAKPSRSVRVADAMTIARGEESFEIEVQALSDVRGPASIAQTLYSETEASRLRRESLRAERAAARAGYRAPETKPDKRARRLIRALGDIDAT
jgi:ribosome-associated heat shock protein Hsp15